MRICWNTCPSKTQVCFDQALFPFTYKALGLHDEGVVFFHFEDLLVCRSIVMRCKWKIVHDFPPPPHFTR